MTKEYVYLAGPMEDCSEEWMKSWREYMSFELEQSGILCLDPTRRVSFHDQLGEHIQDITKTTNICKRIFKQDLQDIANFHWTFAQFGHCFVGAFSHINRLIGNG